MVYQLHSVENERIASYLDSNWTQNALLQAVARLPSKQESLDWKLSTKNSALRTELLNGIPRLVGSGTAAQDCTFRSLLYSHGKKSSDERSEDHSVDVFQAPRDLKRDASASLRCRSSLGSMVAWSPISAHPTLELLGPH